MAHWKRLTATDGVKIDVNMDVVAYIRPHGDFTQIFFVGGQGERFLSVGVKELLDDIHKVKPLRSM